MKLQLGELPSLTSIRQRANLILDQAFPNPAINSMELVEALVEKAEERGISNLIFVRDDGEGRTTEFTLVEMRAAIRRNIQVMRRSS